MKLLILVAALALVSAEDLEFMAKKMIGKFNPDINDEANEKLVKERLTSLTTGDFARGAVDEFGKTESNTIELGIGSIGATYVAVAQGKQAVEVSSVYGFGAGSVTVVKGKQSQTFLAEEADAVSLESVKEVNQPLIDKYVKDIVKSDGGKGVVIELGGQGMTEFKLKTNDGKIKAKSFGGFGFASATHVSKQ